ncbi:MAG: hypothetical protein ACQEQK_00590 [Thermodesulfobacteriota bacterium]
MTQCVQCDAILREQVAPVSYKGRGKRELFAIICVACSCMSFVLSFGVSGMYRDGGILWGMISLALVLISINWVRKLEQLRDKS